MTFMTQYLLNESLLCVLAPLKTMFVSVLSVIFNYSVICLFGAQETVIFNVKNSFVA